MRRRGLLKKFTYVGGIVTASSLPYVLARLLSPKTKQQKSNTRLNALLKPPGAMNDDASFNQACIGCSLCGEVCPPACIKFRQRDGGNEVNLPYIDPVQSGCTLCGKCMDVCPTEALVKVARNQIDMGVAQIDRTACYPWTDNGICGACVTICPLGDKAISFDFANIYRPVVNDACVGCGLCVEVCPHPVLPIRIVQHGQTSIASHRV